MTREIDPDLFARLMKLSPKTRHDLLEYFGQTSVPPGDVARLVKQHGAEGDGDRP
ncbi:hypothetical protein [Hasllibacter sp. MH4015]|uniref:hypothetical protein n=1 Tax=Hasllibacter sp. MH4015 TaxID=2854029 RepID=UPI001CD4DBFB|nr:hypothetical protein [Hasllibacter sp. MH4015]